MASKVRAANSQNSSWIHIHKKLFLLLIALSASLVFDISLIRVYDIVNKQFIPLEVKEVLSTALAVMIISSGYVLLFFVRPQQTQDNSMGGLNLKKIYGLTLIIHSISAAFIALLFLQTTLLSYYNTLTMLVTILFNYGLSIFTLSIFVIRMFLVISFKRNAIFVIMFAVAFGTITLNIAATAVNVTLRLLDRPNETRFFVGGSMDISKGRYNLLDDLYFVSSILSFVTAWVASVTMLARYSQKLGKIWFWSISISPLIFFIGQFASSFVILFSSLIHLDPFFLASLSTTLAILSKPIGGLMLAVVFWAMAGSVANNTILRNHLIIAGIGILLLFASNQALLLSIAPYPPFGLATIGIMGVSAFLIFVGVYTSAITISVDAELRKSIRNFAKSNLTLLDNLIPADKAAAIQRQALESAVNESIRMTQKTGVEAEFDENEAKEYLNLVLNELRERQSEGNSEKFKKPTDH
jgi:hypothetical protein